LCVRGGVIVSGVSGAMVQKRKVILWAFLHANRTRRTGCDYFLEHEIVCINEWFCKFSHYFDMYL
jgi:hypothetical protein